MDNYLFRSPEEVVTAMVKFIIFLAQKVCAGKVWTKLLVNSKTKELFVSSRSITRVEILLKNKGLLVSVLLVQFLWYSFRHSFNF